MNEIIKTEDKKKLPRKKGTDRKKDLLKGKQYGGFLVTGGIFCMIAGIILILSGTVKTGASALASGYLTSYETEKEAAYEEKYEDYKTSAEEKYHVSNRVSIYIGGLEETQKLEVLKVSDVEFMIVNEEDNQDKLTSWLEVPGEGTFVVDLKAGEYIVDNERAHVLVRVPYPELTSVKIDYKNVDKILFKHGIMNKSYRVGEELARQQLNEAEVLFRKEFLSNQTFFLSARKSAGKTIEALIRQLNPEIPELTVDVEFY